MVLLNENHYQSHMRVIDNHVGWLEEEALKVGKDKGSLEVLELGVYLASSTGAFLRAIKELGGGHLTCVDHADYERYVLAKAEEAGLDESSFTFIKANCEDPATVEKVRGEYDLIFVDAEHTKLAVAYEVENYVKPFLRKGGVALFHDVLCPKFDVIDWWQSVDENDWELKDVSEIGPSSIGILMKK
jgi:predicted O-methyltransferase YrrM